MKSQIVLKDIQKTFRDKGKGSAIPVLRGVDMAIDAGEMVAIRGASGAGKSTLLHILGCLDRPTGGVYLLDGVDLSRRTASALAKIRNTMFGFVMQNFALIEEDTALQNVAIPLIFGDTPLHRIDKLAMEQLEMLGIGSLASKQVSRLSGGEKQRVAIARALINHPQIILADEPTGALDTANTELVMDIFKMLNRSGKTVVIVTHDDDVARECSRVIAISDGRVSNSESCSCNLVIEG